MKIIPRATLAVSFVAVWLAVPAAAQAEDVQCTIKLKACGSVEHKLSPLTKVKEGICPMVVDVVTVGTKPKNPYSSATVWIGVSISGETLIFGKGEANAGIALECAWNHDKPKPEQQIASLKASIPQLLKNEEFRKQFPSIKKIDMSKMKTTEVADKTCAEALAAFAKQK